MSDTCSISIRYSINIWTVTQCSVFTVSLYTTKMDFKGKQQYQSVDFQLQIMAFDQNIEFTI